MAEIQYTKLLTLTLVNLGAIYLAGTGAVPGEQALVILAASLGYVFGNGHALVDQQKQKTKAG